MGHKWPKQAIAALMTTALVLAACSSDDDASPTSEPPPATDSPDTVSTDPTPTTMTTDELVGEGLELGRVTPAPGLLATLAQGQARGAAFAVDDVDGGGGVLDGPLTVNDFAAQPGAAPADNVAAAVDGGAQQLIGPVGSDDALDFRDAVAESGELTCSASATLPRITRDQESLTLFRTAIPDGVTSTYLASVVTERRDAAAPAAPWKVTIVARGDEYGLSISNSLAAILEAAGMEPSVVGYEPRRVLFTGTVDEVLATQPDLTVIVSYEEGGNLLASLVAAGLDPASMIGLDAFFRPRIASIATPGADGDPAAVDGFTMVGTMGNRAFLQRLYDDDPNGQVANAPQAYDCAIVLALATQAVADGASATMAAAVVDVTGEGTTCTTYDDCLQKLSAGDDIDYDGVSGNIALDENGDPTFARFTTATLLGGEVTDITSTDVDLRELTNQQEAYAAAALTTKIQQALRFLGFYDGPINGLDTEEFRSALAAFQASVGLPPTGIYDEATDAALRAALGPYADLLSASTADIQRLLTDLGFYTGPIDGIWTDAVTEAVRALQRELGVPETGVFDAATIRAVYERGVEDATTTTTTTVPETTVPETTAPPTTAPAPPTTVPPTTVPPTTVPPTTVPPTTVPPTTVAPTTVPPDPTVPTTTVPIDPPEPELPHLFDVLAADADFSMLVELLQAAGFHEDLDDLNLYTVFAPTNQALETLTTDEFNELLGDPDRLIALLGYHVAPGRLPVASIAGDVETVNGALLPTEGSGATLTVGGAPITKPDIMASNGIVQGIGALLTVPS